MKFLGYSLVLGSAAVASAREQPSDIEPAACESYRLPAQNELKYHNDKVCNRAEFNSFKSRLGRHHKYREMKASLSINAVPNSKTVTCPLEVVDLKGESSQQGHGFDTMWIVENTSAEPIVLSYLKDGVEYSATNTKITPPHLDPDAILAPGKWRAIMAFDGHVFHARAFDSKSNMLGPVVLQHRTGLIPIGQKFQDLQCPSDDPEPIVPETKEIDPKFARTPPAINRPCNTIDIGFRNMANCPLHGYFITANNETCQEKFKFHLGMNHVNPQDFMWGWDSPTKFEGSFVGHSFAFRSAADPSILVETVTLAPSLVIDCPELKNKVQINKVTTVGEMLQTIVPITDQGEVAKREQVLLNVLEQMDKRVMASLLNQTHVFDANATTSVKGARRRAHVDPNVYMGIHSL